MRAKKNKIYLIFSIKYVWEDYWYFTAQTINFASYDFVIFANNQPTFYFQH